MKKPRQLAEFLFGSSQLSSEQEALVDDLAGLWEDLEHKEEREPKKGPLASALKALGIKGAALEEDPEGYCFVTGDETEFHKINEILASPEAIDKLGELGWVAAKCGDVAMTGEPAEFKFRFIEITTPEADDKETTPGSKDLSAIVKAAREFATEPVVEPSDGGPVPKDGFGKATSGAAAKKAIKDSKTPDALVERLLDEDDSPCKCARCKTKDAKKDSRFCEECGKHEAKRQDAVHRGNLKHWKSRGEPT